MIATAASSAVHGQTPAAVRPVPTAAALVPAVVLPAGACVAAAVLALSSTGSMVVAAALIGVGTRSRWGGVAAVLAAASVAVRFSTAEAGDVAGIQSVLGPAGIVGPPLAAASAWLAAAAVVLAARALAPALGPGDASRDESVWPGRAVLRFLPAVAAGALAAAIVAGPGPGGGLVLRVAATVVAVALAIGLTLGDRHPRIARVRQPLAVLAGAGALALAAWPG